MLFIVKCEVIPLPPPPHTLTHGRSSHALREFCGPFGTGWLGRKRELPTPAPKSWDFYAPGDRKWWHQLGQLCDVKGEIASSRQRCQPGGQPRQGGGDHRDGERKFMQSCLSRAFPPASTLWSEEVSIMGCPVPPAISSNPDGCAVITVCHFPLVRAPANWPRYLKGCALWAEHLTPGRASHPPGLLDSSLHTHPSPPDCWVGSIGGGAWWGPGAKGWDLSVRSLRPPHRWQCW